MTKKTFQITSKNQTNFLAAILIILTTFVAAAFIFKYCELFFDFGNYAKERLTKTPILAFFVTPLFFWLSAYLCRKLARGAAGNTVAHVESSFIELKNHPQSLGKLASAFNLRAVLVNAVSSLLSTFGGGALGREAPSVYMSASIFGVAAQKFKKFLPKISLENWICAGTAIGFAVAFHSPVAGFVYVVEKLFNSKTKNFFADIFWTTIALFVVIIFLRQATPLFATKGSAFWFGFELILVGLVAVICGILAFFFKKISLFYYEKIAKIKSNLWHLAPIIAGFAVSIISIYGGVDSFSGGIKTASKVLEGEAINFVEVAARIANTIITFISGCAGGLVAPSIAIGAGIGSLFADLLQNIDAKIFILGGMVAFLAPTLGTPFAAAIAVVETTSQPLLAFTFLFCFSAISFAVSSLIAKIRRK